MKTLQWECEATIRVPVVTAGRVNLKLYAIWRGRNRWAVTAGGSAPTGPGYRTRAKALAQLRNEVAAHLRRFRIDNNMTQEELADRLGVRGITVSRWERGVALPSREVLKTLVSLAKG